MSEQQHLILEGTGRAEAFSDGVIAIIVTILILEIHVPEIEAHTNIEAWHAIISILPKLAGFLISFVSVAIFWVNHHYFFNSIAKSNSSLFWYNNHLLFWLAVIPFATAFLGDYPTIPVAVALYGFVLTMAALAFNLMIHFVYFRSPLTRDFMSLANRKKQFQRSLIGVVVYSLSIPLAFLNPYISLSIFALVPIYYFLPDRTAKHSE